MKEKYTFGQLHMVEDSAWVCRTRVETPNLPSSMLQHPLHSTIKRFQKLSELIDWLNDWLIDWLRHQTSRAVYFSFSFQYSKAVVQYYTPSDYLTSDWLWLTSDWTEISQWFTSDSQVTEEIDNYLWILNVALFSCPVSSSRVTKIKCNYKIL